MSIQDVALVGSSAPMRQLRALVATIAPMQLPVLIEGETGTGKELVASLLHQQSGRSGGLVAFNVCALGESMFEDALFGHVKGAYTGALNESLGFLREANGGTAFFDEISGLPLPLQAKLLRAIETGVFRPIGASRDARSNFQADRGDEREPGRARRRGPVPRRPQTPAERNRDSNPVARRARRRHSGAVPAFCAEHRRRRRIDQRGRAGVVAGHGVARERPRAQTGGRRGVRFCARHRRHARARDRAVTSRVGPSAARVADHLVERRELVSALERASWDTEFAATTLGIHRATIYRRMRRHGIDMPLIRQPQFGDGATG